ncbi:MAG: replicative DNA helicase [Candidatus Methylomirabilales bacterium]
MSERILPQSPDLEGIILQAVLQDEQAAASLTATLSPGVFVGDRERWTFEAAVRCINRGIPCDVHTVAEELNRRGKLLEVGSEYLDRLVDGPPLPNWSHHARLLQEKAERRRIILAAERIAAAGYADEDPIDEYRGKAEAMLFTAMQTSRTDEILTPKQLSATLDEDAAPLGLTTGLSLLDSPFPILAEGRLVVLAGRPRIGKTALACAILARHALATPAVPAFFASCEQNGREIAERILALHTGRTLYEIRNASLKLAEVERLATSGLYLSEAGAPSLGTLLGQIRAARATYGIRLVVVDHIGKVTGGRKETRTLEVGDVARGLKAIAKDLRIPVLALCQLNRLVEGRNVKRPLLSDLRESGEIEQEADAVLFLWTAEENLNKLELPVALTLAKHRHGATGDLKGTFDRPRLRFKAGGGNDEP